MAEPSEVADDFKADLKDLTSNDRYAISNFTVIAKESVQHADAIANVIIDHIMEVSMTLLMGHDLKLLDVYCHCVSKHDLYFSRP